MTKTSAPGESGTRLEHPGETPGQSQKLSLRGPNSAGTVNDSDELTGVPHGELRRPDQSINADLAMSVREYEAPPLR
ncbi:MAG: hypothetical protein QOE58_2291 [Actinomycetota bacterium]|nr:hypothetical protein [Actinomycetota bacterium]